MTEYAQQFRDTGNINRDPGKKLQFAIYSILQFAYNCHVNHSAEIYLFLLLFFQYLFRDRIIDVYSSAIVVY